MRRASCNGCALVAIYREGVLMTEQSGDLECLTRGGLFRFYYDHLDKACDDSWCSADDELLKIIEQEITDRYGTYFTPF